MSAEQPVAAITLNGSVHFSISTFQEAGKPALVAARLSLHDFHRGIAMTPMEADEIAAALREAAAKARELKETPCQP
jgi:hypothetical protein